MSATIPGPRPFHVRTHLPPARGATAKDLAFRVHTDLGKGFIRAINARTKMVVGHDYAVQDGDVIKIVARA